MTFWALVILLLSLHTLKRSKISLYILTVARGRRMEIDAFSMRLQSTLTTLRPLGDRFNCSYDHQDTHRDYFLVHTVAMCIVEKAGSALTRNSAHDDGAFFSAAVTLIFILPDCLRSRCFQNREIDNTKLTAEKLRTNSS